MRECKYGPLYIMSSNIINVAMKYEDKHPHRCLMTVRFTHNELVAFTMFSAQRGKGDLPDQGKVHPAPAPLLLTGGDGGTWGCDI